MSLVEKTFSALYQDHPLFCRSRELAATRKNLAHTKTQYETTNINPRRRFIFLAVFLSREADMTFKILQPRTFTRDILRRQHKG